MKNIKKRTVIICLAACLSVSSAGYAMAAGDKKNITDELCATMCEVPPFPEVKVETKSADTETVKDTRTAEEKRQEIVKLAKSFEGGKYVYGGSDPNKGADCSGFTGYIYKQVLGLELPHNSLAQSKLYKNISKDSIQPGDIIFYGKNGTIDHCAIYIGNGRIMHAATTAHGIREEDWDFEPLLKICNVVK